MNSRERLKEAFNTVWSTEGDTTPSKTFKHNVIRCEELLYGVKDLNGKKVMDVGGGRGFVVHYLATCTDVVHVSSVDEYIGRGSPENAFDTILRMQSFLGNAEKTEVIKNDFMKVAPGKKYDMLIFVNVLHHIVNGISKGTGDPDKMGIAEDIMRHTASLLNDGGEVLIQELGNVNICPLPQFSKYLNNVTWKSKLSSASWRKVLKSAGFEKIKVRYRLPLNLPRNPILRLMFNNYPANILADSSYVVRARFQG